MTKPVSNKVVFKPVNKSKILRKKKLNNESIRIEIQQENPKQKFWRGQQSKAWTNYEITKKAKTKAEFLNLGGTQREWNFDVDKGFIRILDNEPIEVEKQDTRVSLA